MREINNAPNRLLDASEKVLRTGFGVANWLSENITKGARSDKKITEIYRTQRILQQHTGNFGIVNLLDQDEQLPDLKKRVETIARTIVDTGFASKDTTIEVRPILPEESFYDDKTNVRREIIVPLMERALVKKGHIISTIPNTHPILPSVVRATVIGPAQTWQAIAPELDDLSHQMGENPKYAANPQAHVAILGITDTHYANRLFGNQIKGGDLKFRQPGFFVLNHVGDLPEDNRLVGFSNDN